MSRDMGVGLSRTAVMLRAVGGLKKLNLTWHLPDVESQVTQNF